MAEPLWTMPEVGAALGQTEVAAGAAANGVSIDTRTLRPGDLFVAIAGDRTDGHDYIEAAFEKGAAAAIVTTRYEVPASIALQRLFRVPDTLAALNALGLAARDRSQARIAGVTGSVGKTGTKEMLKAMLFTAGATHASEKSYNNHWGVPLSLARMPRGTEFGVFEMGMNHAGEIAPLTRMVRPHVALVTWVAAVHIEFFTSVEEIADAKAEIFEGAEPGGAAVLPIDNAHYARLAVHAKRGGLDVLSFGEAKGSAGQLLSVEALEDGSRVTATVLGVPITFTIAAHGRHIASNAVGALTAAKMLGADLDAAAASLAAFTPPEGRGRRRIIETPRGPVLLIDETYNANPASMRAALEVLSAIPKARFARRVAILGDMLELGHAAREFHADLADTIDSNEIDLVLCAGPSMRHLHERLMPHKRGGWAATAEELKPAMLRTVRSGDAVTIKGSLGSRMGPLADALDAHLRAIRHVKDGGGET